jgi:hypothetical protein
MRHSRTVVRLALLAATATGACGGGSTHGIATAGNGSGGGPPTTVSGDQAFIDYSHCMRNHGVADYPDPTAVAGHDGLSLHYEGDQSNSVFQDANAACQHLIQAVIDQKRLNVHDQLTPEKLQALIAYSRCMREHQIPLLDPDPNDGHISFGSVPGVPDTGIGRYDPQFQTADNACRSNLPADVPDDGTGPP